MVRSLAATALAVAALVSLDQIPTAEAAGKTSGHMTWVLAEAARKHCVW